MNMEPTNRPPETKTPGHTATGRKKEETVTTPIGERGIVLTSGPECEPGGDSEPGGPLRL